VIVQHGLLGSVSNMDGIADALLAQGFRVLRYDLFDRGHSVSDPARYPIKTAGLHPMDFTLENHVQQMRDVLVLLDLTETPFVHCGHSTGGVVGIGYAAQYPQFVKGLCLIATICLPLSLPIATNLVDVPILGPYAIENFGSAVFMMYAKKTFVEPDSAIMKPILEKVARQLRENERCVAAIRSTSLHCRGFATGSAEQEFVEVCKVSIPVHLIWGTEDDSVPYQHCIRLREIAMAHGTAVTDLTLEGMPHCVFYPDAKPRECEDSIREFAWTAHRGKRAMASTAKWARCC